MELLLGCSRNYRGPFGPAPPRGAPSISRVCDVSTVLSTGIVAREPSMTLECTACANGTHRAGVVRNQEGLRCCSWLQSAVLDCVVQAARLNEVSEGSHPTAVAKVRPGSQLVDWKAGRYVLDHRNVAVRGCASSAACHERIGLQQGRASCLSIDGQQTAIVR